MMNPFNVVLPPGWVQFDLGESISEQVSPVAKNMVEEFPANVRAQARTRLQATLTRALTGLASNGAVATYMAADNPATAAIFPTVVIHPVNFTVDGEALQPLDYLVAVMAGGDAELIDPPGMVGVKLTRDREDTEALQATVREVMNDFGEGEVAGERQDVAAAGRRVRQLDYTIGVPNTVNNWMRISAEITSTLGDDAEEAISAVTAFLDAWVSAITWQDMPEGVEANG